MTTGLSASGALLAIAAAKAAAKDPNTYVLKPKANQKIFDQLIVQEELLHLKNVGHLDDQVQPLAVFVVGQTASGKTRLAADLLDVMQGRQPAHLVSDVYKAYHPKYKTVIKEHPNIASAATSIDARKWLNLAIRWLIQRHIDVLLEAACRHPDDVTSLISEFRAAGYRVLVAIMAVPECLSLLGTMVRFYDRLPEAKSAKVALRVTPGEVHHETCVSLTITLLQEGLLAVANFIDNSAAVKNVVVLRRNNLVAYQNFRGLDGLWVRPAVAFASLDLEGVRPLPATEHESFVADCLYVEEQRAKKLQRKKQKEKEQKKGKEKVTNTTIEDVEASLAGLMSMGGRLNASFPHLKQFDIKEWMFGDWDLNNVGSGLPKQNVETVLPRNSILQESARVEH
ncbi:zeta toxin [Diaporthe helianthi]|uniref:Zeta toxin n=1 Tax=Diaporthe helianthi TaxID=158607 RepID=A0A2P5HEM4_DIAHE|nr:zeta toxin [Diaporthe helianthi]